MPGFTEYLLVQKISGPGFPISFSFGGVSPLKDNIRQIGSPADPRTQKVRSFVIGKIGKPQMGPNPAYLP
jgi:hypothetical protein